MNASGDAPSAPSGAAAPRTAPPPVAVGEPEATAAEPAAAVSDSADFKALIGRWVRLDSPYVIEIRSAGDDGTLDAAYYNPRPINVSRAEARDRKGKLQVFLELRDVNYPGSTYTLTYEPAKDLLQGVYFQAALRQSYKVTFRRLRTR
jgi:hypothetical protein